ncbi:MAG: carbon starvation protein A [candidate division Zixibacteria bacterium]|nr:carbon starvation protein A [candidate division Zixibacteria bacterium]
MVIVYVVGISGAALLLGYLLYGKFLARFFKLDNNIVTPACQINDGIDFVPAKANLLLGQHFSAIAAAGPIVGPILAGIWFGWLPALLWIIFGSIFIGGIHDFSSLVASVRHKAVSIVEVVKGNMSRTSHILFMIFVWLCLVYVVIAFTDITAQTFKAVAVGEAYGPGVAASSILYIAAAMIMGILLYKFKLGVGIATAVFLPVVLFIVWLGPHLPQSILSALSGISAKQWDIILLIYCFIASIIPMWLLLQPRGYLGGWLLYLTIAVGLIGAVFGGFDIRYPAINTVGFASILNGKLIFPILFITVACGACSGFHSIVSSGTTSKQLAKESDARPVGYGAMLLEAFVAVLALATVMILAPGSEILKNDPNMIYANGLARYLGLVGIDFRVAFPFALLAFSTFVYDTLDVCTRLGRYIFQELFGLKGRSGGMISTAATLLFPLIFLMLTEEKGYLVAWPIFGTSNQLLAGLTLLAVSVWLTKTGRNAIYTIIPMIFMLVMTIWSLILLIIPFVEKIPLILKGVAVKPDIFISGIFGIILLILSFALIIETLNTLILKRSRS